MKSLAISFAVAASLAGANAARADQCQLVDGNTAMRALQLLHDHPLIVSYCEPCNDRAPGAATPAGFVHTERDRTGAYQVVVDRREIDLAYTYVMTGWNRWENLAALTGCPASGVTRELELDARPPVPPPAPPQHFTAPPERATYVITQDRSVSFWTLLGTCTATSAACTLGLFVALRRRRGMKPRAIKLLDRS